MMNLQHRASRRPSAVLFGSEDKSQEQRMTWKKARLEEVEVESRRVGWVVNLQQHNQMAQHLGLASVCLIIGVSSVDGLTEWTR